MTAPIARDEVPSIGLDDDRIKFFADRLLEVARIRSAAEISDGSSDKEDLASYAGEVVTLRRSLLAAYDEIDRLRADAGAAQALLLEQAADRLSDLIFWTGDDAHGTTLVSLKEARNVILAVADADGLAEVAKLRMELDKWFEGAGAHHVASMQQAQRADHLATDNARLAAQVQALTGALRQMVYATTHLSAEEDDGSHWCRINKADLTQARAALEAAEIASWPPEMQAEYQATVAMRGVAKRIAEDQIAARDAGEGN